MNVEHEEVLLIPRWVDCERVTFKYGLGEEFIEVLQVLHKVGLDRTDPVTGAGRGRVAPRRRGRRPCPTRPRSATGCGGAPAPAPGSPAPARTAPREVYLYHVADNEETMARDGAQAVVWQTAINPVIALELLGRRGVEGRRRPRAGGVPARPFLDLLVDHGSPWGLERR